MWVDPVKGHANMAITIKVDRTNPRITLDTYEWNSRTQCAHVTQSLPDYHPLRLHVRSPEIPKETDIRLEQQNNLMDMASCVWVAQE
ncbi:hypothetical protein N7527_007136 [Penicillium freii]|nr:hypothetical protein N7527_007136 [Penicillium freii]